MPDLKLNIQILKTARSELYNELKTLQGFAEKKPIKIKLKFDDGQIKGELQHMSNTIQHELKNFDITKDVGKKMTDQGNKQKDNLIQLGKQFAKAQDKLQKKIAAGGKYNGKYDNVVKAGLEKDFKNELGNAKKTMNEMLRMRAEMNQKGGIANMSKDDIKVIKSLNKEAENHVSNISRLTSEVKAKTAGLDSHDSLRMAQDKMGARLSNYESKYGTQLRKNTALYEKYLTLINKANSGQFRSLSEMNREFATFRTQARSSGVEIETFGSKLERTFGARIRSAMAGQGVFLIQSAMRDIVTNAVEVDTAMTELKKVTTATDTEYANFMDGASERAQRLGATLRDTVSATADYARLGYDIPEATKLADSAIIYQNVGDGVESMDQATTSLISTMQGFSIAASDSMSIVDKFNEVANNYASSAGDIGEITKRSAASMAAAGNTLDETIALGVTANEVQQDADVVGTALKTMSMRLRGSKTDLQSAGLDAEGMATSTSKLREEMLNLAGVDIMKDANTFKSSYDILMGIGEVWDSLSDINQANITELLFGKRQTENCLVA